MTEIPWDVLRTLAAIASATVALLTVTLSIRALRMARGKELIERIDAGDRAAVDAITKLGDKLSRTDASVEELRRHSVQVDERIRAAPTHEDLQRIDGHLRDVSRAVAALDERSDQTLKTVRSIQSYLLERSK